MWKVRACNYRSLLCEVEKFNLLVIKFTFRAIKADSFNLEENMDWLINNIAMWVLRKSSFLVHGFCF